VIKKLFTILFGLVVLSNLSHAETFKIYMGVPAGSLSDVYTRKLYDHVNKITGDNFVIVNRPGADQMVAYQLFIDESRNNPNVIFSSGTSSLVASSIFRPELKLNPLNETKSLITVLKVHYYLVARADSPIKSIKEVTGKLNVGSSNATNNALFVGAKFDKDVQLIPFKGDNEIIISLLQKEIDLASIISINPLLYTHKDRIKIVADFNPVIGAVGYSVAKNFPDEKLQEINRALNQIVHHPDIKQWFINTMGSAPVGGSPEDYDATINSFKTLINSKIK
jgi:tripartite-type tricarboxylate transporter receptor subunit TctC